MLSFDKWKQNFNENFGLLGGVIGGIRTPQSVASPVVQGTVDTNAFRTLGDSFPESSAPKWMGTEIKMEDDTDNTDDTDEMEEIDMEDVEDEEGDEDMEDEDMEDEDMDDEDMEDEDMDDEDMDDEDMDEKGMEGEDGIDDEHMKDMGEEEDNMIHHHHMHHHHHMQEEGAKHSKDKCSKCGAKYMEKNTCMKCGAYMKTESTNYSNIPSLKEWQQSVASMYDPKFFDKNYDGITMTNEDVNISGTIMAALNNLDKKLGIKSAPYYIQIIEEIFNKLMPKIEKAHISNLKGKVKYMLTKLENLENSPNASQQKS